MNSFETAGVIALIAYSLYKQTHRRRLDAGKRFVLPLVYVLVGVATGGFVLPTSGTAWLLLVTGLVVSLATGLARGMRTCVWAEDGAAWSQGTALTVGLFLAMIAAKTAIGFWAGFQHLATAGGFGEIVLGIGVMMLLQAQIVHMRATSLVVPAPQGSAVSA